MAHQARSDAMGKKMRTGTLRELFGAFQAFKSLSGHRSTIGQYGAHLEQLIKLKLFTGDESANEITSVQITRKHFDKSFTMRDIRRTFKTLAGMLHFLKTNVIL
ncbi:TPA: hypothetical protein QCK11_003879 [Enterobacter asburiae]|uniref:hypothetical protein n=1 Tax=Enterobacter sp. C4G1 TaxID=3458724 RepID=UPI003300E485|nr:hypothetical protein [Enterobacter asburiae]HDR2805511.1 hypothetical protein [Enterobacter asburiae]HDR2811030.1 hypothetical protein [Enterobacter asburiae]HDR2816464.1 hypothetical protein [Enterobacter asburiae]HDR2863865.1 hypothetical protein [Enterobacter asburiae]